MNGVSHIPLPGRPLGFDLHSRGHLRCPLTPTDFLCGPENLVAANSVADLLAQRDEGPSLIWLYGPHGVGKSHLAQGLADLWQQRTSSTHKDPTQRPLVAIASDLARDERAACHDDPHGERLAAFRAPLESASLLVIEDLQHVAAQPHFTRELIRLLDQRAHQHRHTVVTSSAGPAAAIFPPPLASRLAAGLPLRLVPPNLAARRALVSMLADQLGLTLQDRARDCLAAKFAAGPRALAPPLVHLALENPAQPITAEQMHALIARPRLPRAAIRDIAVSTARWFRLKLSELKGRSRRVAIVRARSVAMLLTRELTDLSLADIGNYFGGRDHTTVLHNCRKTQAAAATDDEIRRALAQLRLELAG